MIELRFCSLGENTMKYVFSSLHHITGFMMLIYFIIGGINPDHLVNVVSAKFLHHKITSFPL